MYLALKTAKAHLGQIQLDCVAKSMFLNRLLLKMQVWWLKLLVISNCKIMLPIILTGLKLVLSASSVVSLLWKDFPHATVWLHPFGGAYFVDQTIFGEHNISESYSAMSSRHCFLWRNHLVRRVRPQLDNSALILWNSLSQIDLPNSPR